MIRSEGEFDLPVGQPNAVTAVLDTLDDDAIPGTQVERTRGLAQHLMTLGDDVPVGPGTSRLTVAAAAVYAADPLLPGTHLTQQQVADAASAVVATSHNRLKRYNCELVDVYEARYGTEDPGVILDGGPDTRC